MMIDAMLLEALSSHLHQRPILWKEPIEEEIWNDLFVLAQRQGIFPMIYETVFTCPAFESVDPEKKALWKKEAKRQIIGQMKRTEELKSLYQRLNKEKDAPLIVKGILCRELYPVPEARISNDEDFLIPWERFSIIDQKLQQLGMSSLLNEERVRNAFEVTYQNKRGELIIELHKSLFSKDSDAYGDYNLAFQQIYERSITVQIDGILFQTLGYTDHMAYLIAHAGKHFLHSGVGIRQVCDILLFAKTYEDKISWDEVYETCEALHICSFAAAIFEIGTQYLDLKLIRPYELEQWKSFVDPKDLLKDILESGAFGDSSMARKHSSTITLDAVAEEKKGKKARFSLIKTLFPKKSELKEDYAYLQKFSFLLPIAWANRLIRYYKESKKYKGAVGEAKKSFTIAKKRMELLKKYKIIKSGDTIH